MKFHPVPTVFAAIVLLAATLPAAALSRDAYSLEILVDGTPLTEYAARGTTYVEAVEGREYSIRLRNHTGRRIAVALAVDGLNTIDAKQTRAREASKWILGPYETITLDGWQTGSDVARRFFFTTEDRSYGAWLGKTSDLGGITAAVFREKSKPVPIQRMRKERWSRPSAESEGARDLPGMPAPSADARGMKGAGDSVAPEPEELSEDLAATGIGREVEHRVQRVRFDAEPSPAAVLRVRYEYRDALVRLGVLPPSYAWREDPLERRERARGFEDLEFAPDPFRGPRP